MEAATGGGRFLQRARMEGVSTVEWTGQEIRLQPVERAQDSAAGQAHIVRPREHFQVPLTRSRSREEANAKAGAGRPGDELNQLTTTLVADKDSAELKRPRRASRNGQGGAAVRDGSLRISRERMEDTTTLSFTPATAGAPASVEVCVEPPLRPGRRISRGRLDREEMMQRP
ncbi:hypothetical protein KFE25_009173 [Diacronema lutheri]|uniref:Uncharacterized protein n=1 Tax=Diacronema lutheri TaxID=2081491 RepID=A0A8J6CD95_DIALT|nr:hypothetical protein KFE25_009173 [Diacronema lutheri]